ncbi:flagellin [Clostridium butyricum]|uniref:flagellin N-terminal helical domain-containing protein n=1 Tax=Clostridium butyricum TaxID=1492 RepID=UPI0013D85413|nr:flagellin [Clostridium butyricum]MCQ2022228.1 flagellin [Clostridium butyricum]NFB70081.1 flagellin [Clostridium butyricum]NFB89868.1 flagellin [Clostridium butyricum]
MRINNNISSLESCNKLKKNNKDNISATRKLTSGYRINYAADDAAGLGISEKLRTQIKGLNQASNNTQDGISMTQTIEGATNEVHDILNRMVTLSTQSANGTNSDDDRKLIDKEVQQLKDEIDRIAKDTEFNGKKVLDGSYGKDGQRLDLLVGENPGFIITFPPIESIACDSLEIDDLSVSTKEDSEKAIDKLSKAINDVSARRVDIGVTGNRLQHSVKSVDNNSENITASESRIRDTDMAKEAMVSVKSNILMNSTEAVLKQANSNPEYVVTLLNSR